MAGRGSAAGLLAYGDANAIVVEMAGEVLPVVVDTPVLAGVNGTDPFRSMPRFLRELQELGFSGVQNFPTVGVIDGNFRQVLEETGMSFKLEVEMIRAARELDLLTTPYAFDPEEARWMADAGADIVVAHMNTTTKGLIGVTSAPSLDEAVARVQAIADAAYEVNPTCSSSAMAARSRSPRTRSTSSTERPASSASTARRAWSGCRSRRRSPTTRGGSSSSRSRRR